MSCEDYSIYIDKTYDCKNMYSSIKGYAGQPPNAFPFPQPPEKEAKPLSYSEDEVVNTAIKNLMNTFDNSKIEYMFLRDIAQKLSKITVMKNELNEYEAEGYKKALEEESLKLIEKLLVVLDSVNDSLHKEKNNHNQLKNQLQIENRKIKSPYSADPKMV